jgi:hypothetical protein
VSRSRNRRPSRAPRNRRIASRSSSGRRAGNGILVTLRRVDAPYPRRQVFVTNREMKMGYDDVYKACFVCVDQGRKENAIAVPKGEIEAGLPPA